jgi:glycosyltransferase involved in cell wall biosynthesis
LFCSRTTLFSGPGGDTVQILKTAEFLRSMGCEVEISIDPDVDVEGFDILHLFNLTRPQEAYPQAKRAQRQGIPVALSPIYVDYREADRTVRGPLQRLLFQCMPGSSAEYLKMAARAIVNREANRGTATILRKGFRSAQRELIEMSSMMLPNSESEMLRIRRDFPEAQGSKYAVIPNAIDAHLFDPKHTLMAQEYKDCVLSVGRIERRKNQLELVRALKGTGLKFVLIGKPGPNHLKYFEQILREADENVSIIGQVDHSELPRYYAACKVHALVSWMETTGLSSLEAAAMGANIVITAKGDTRDYFGDLAYYCSPGSVDSIREAVLAAHRAPRSLLLRDRILQRYTWDDTARCTLAAYQNVLCGA